MKRILLSLFLLILIFGANIASAQIRPQVLLTWKADSYIPKEYKGRALPVVGSGLKISVMVLDGGQFADISQSEINWYIDGNFYKGGVGMKSLSLDVPVGSPVVLRIKAQVSGYRDLLLSKTIEIPVVRPEAIIISHFSGNNIKANNASLVARPFFFTGNSHDFSYEWKVNDKDPISGKNDVLSMDLSALQDKSNIKVGLIIRNSGETASLVRNFIYTK